MQMRVLFSLLMISIGYTTISPAASAGFFLSFANTNPNPLSAGSSGTLDVFMNTDAGTQLLDGYQLQIKLTPTGGSPAGGLIFSNTQQDAELGVGGTNGYVFFGNSLSQATNTAIGLVTNAGSTYIGFDLTNNLLPVTITTTPKLLYRLNVTGVSAGSYSVDADSLADPSFFTDQLDPTGSGVAFSSSALSLTVTAVPEPTSIVLLALGSAIGGFSYLRRRFKVQTQ